MAPGQNTFSIIPNAPCAINGGLDALQSRPSKRPMTSKQAKKAYQKTNKGPKLSKAEQRRQELFEQDRIRREFEKEKNQARARAARDKKKEKEEKERAEKKKKGLPLVDVRPSQATISWFVRGDKKKKLESQTTINPPATDRAGQDESDGSDGSDDNGSVTPSDEDEPEPPPKKQKTVPLDSVHSPSSTGRMLNCSASSPRDRDVRGTPRMSSNAMQDPVQEQQSLGNATPNADDLAAMALDKSFNEPVDAVTSPLKDVIDPDGNSLLDEDIIPNSPSPSKSPGYYRSPIAVVEELLPVQKIKGSTATPSNQLPLQPLGTSEINSRTNRTPQDPDPEQPKLLDQTASPAIDSSMNTPWETRPPISSKSFRHPKTPMGPPPIPSKFKPGGRLRIVDSGGPIFPPNPVHASSSRSVSNPNPKLGKRNRILQETQEELPPTNTQLFMLGHLDDLFPSPSQEIREIFGESKLGTTRNTAKPKSQAYTNKPPTGGRLSSKSSPDRLDSVIKDEKTRGPFQGHVPPTQASKSPLPPAVNIYSSGVSESFDVPFFSTQDFFLSSQDLKDLGNGKTSPLYPPDKKQPRGLKLGAACDRSRSFHAHILGNHIECAEKPKLVCEANMAPDTAAESNCSSTYSSRVKVNFDNPTDKTNDATSQERQTMPSGALEAQKNMALSRPSPTPFFTSSDREAHRIYTNERVKTIAWESVSTRSTMQQESKGLQRLENENSTWSPPVCGMEDGCINIIKHGTSNPEARTGNSTARPCDQIKGQSRPRSINQLSSSTVSIQSQKGNETNEARPRQNQSRSSYQKMLELLERTNHKQEHQAVTASQETDYGEAGLDDVLNEML
ncbi:hypothetical protein F5Y11DRAFT_327870 [Daldinia sp. FL1419]|nr:hypothetical protein F5Y11DRAFT_327870 [Daldinia sp. FL1419]